MRSVRRQTLTLLAHLPVVIAKENAAETVGNGSPLAIPGIIEFDDRISKGDLVNILDPSGRIIALGESQMRARDLVDREKGWAFKPVRVFPPG